MVKEHGFSPPPSLVNVSWGAFLEERDNAGVDVCVVPGRYTTASYGQISNSDLTRLGREWPDRFVCFAAVDPTSAGATGELEQAINDLGLAGLTLDSGFLDPPRFVDDLLFEPLYRTCTRLKVPVMLTYSGHAGPNIGYADPVRLDRVAAAFPDLTIIVVHAGWPWVIPTIGVAFRRKNVYLSPDMYMKMPGAGGYIEAANGFLRERIFFGSAYPFLPFDEAVNAYQKLPFREDVLADVMGRNAARVLKLN
jgi:predicted TIM-barrel fold metal-dependent hydrolase